MPLLQRGLIWLAQQLIGKESRTVLYRRGNQTRTLSAVVGKSEVQVEDHAGYLTRSFVRDFLIRPEDLILGGQTVLPEVGDRIEETVDGQTYIHEVLPLAGAEAWRWSDPHRRLLRVHTRQLEIQP